MVQDNAIKAKNKNNYIEKEKNTMDKTYIPAIPLIPLTWRCPPELVKLANLLSANVHNVWAVGRIQEGWTYGPARDDARKETPCMVPFEELSDNEKAYVIWTRPLRRWKYSSSFRL